MKKKKKTKYLRDQQEEIFKKTGALIRDLYPTTYENSEAIEVSLGHRYFRNISEFKKQLKLYKKYLKELENEKAKD